MPFRGFLIESKSYMSYATMSKGERVRFWFRFPFAWFRFQWSGLTQRALDGWRAVVKFGRSVTATRK